MSPKRQWIQRCVGDTDPVIKRTMVVTFNVSSMSQLIHAVFYYKFWLCRMLMLATLIVSILWHCHLKDNGSVSCETLILQNYSCFNTCVNNVRLCRYFTKFATTCVCLVTVIYSLHQFRLYRILILITLSASICPINVLLTRCGTVNWLMQDSVSHQRLVEWKRHWSKVTHSPDFG